MLYVRYGYRWSLLSALCVQLVHIFVRLLEAYGYGRSIAVPPDIVGAVLNSAAYSLNKTSKTQWRRIFRKNGRTFWGKTVQVGTELQTHVWCYLVWHRDRQLQQNSWEGRDRMGKECQLDSSEGEVEVRATLVCSLRGALYWMYCIKSISMWRTHGRLRAVTVISFKTYESVSVCEGSINVPLRSSRKQTGFNLCCFV